MAFVCRDPTTFQKALNNFQAPLRAIQAANQEDDQGSDAGNKTGTSAKAAQEMPSSTAPEPLLGALQSAHAQNAIKAAKAAGLIGVVTLEDVLEVLLAEEVSVLSPSLLGPDLFFRFVFNISFDSFHSSILRFRG